MQVLRAQKQMDLLVTCWEAFGFNLDFLIRELKASQQYLILSERPLTFVSSWSYCCFTTHSVYLLFAPRWMFEPCEDG